MMVVGGHEMVVLDKMITVVEETGRVLLDEGAGGEMDAVADTVALDEGAME